MPTSWQTIRVFISSTFRDMHSERDWLVKRVFPALRERLEPYRLHLVDIDLRWGVTEQQAESGGALDVCLDQIDACRPFFLGLLGERYGWVPEKIPTDVTSKLGWTQYTTKKSITELEILYGVLGDPQMHPYSFFCFRAPNVLSELPGEQLANFAEFPTDEERNTLSRRQARARALERRQKLKALKQAIRDAKLPRTPLEDYPCRYAGLKINWRLARLGLDATDRQALEQVAGDGFIDRGEYEHLDDHLRQIVHRYGTVRLGGLHEVFEQQVRDWLWEAICDRLNLPERPTGGGAAGDPLDEERSYHERFIESRTRVYVGRKKLQAELADYADGADEHLCLVTGASGSGKSAALARFATSSADTDGDVPAISHFIGVSPASTSLRQLLHRLCLELKSVFGFTDDVPADTNSLITTFREFIGNVPAERRVVLLIDALNQLDDADNARQLYWLPWQLPPQVKLVVSCISDSKQEEPVLQAFAHRPHLRKEIPPLTSGERRQIIRDVPSLSAKTLDDRQIGLLLSNRATDNPLYLLVALEELRGFGSYEQLGQRMARMPRPPEEEPQWTHWVADALAAAASIDDEEKRQETLHALEQIETTFRQSEPVNDPLTGIFLQVIERLEIDFNTRVVGDVLTLLACARRGLSDRELLDLAEGSKIAVDASASDLFPVLRQLRPYLQQRGTLWDFSHRNLDKAVRMHYLLDEKSRTAAHKRLSEYFRGQDYFLESLEEQRARSKRLPPTPRPSNIRKVDELPYHVLELARLADPGSEIPDAEEWNAVADLLTDWQFLEAKAEAQSYGESTANTEGRA